MGENWKEKFEESESTNFQLIAVTHKLRETNGKLVAALKESNSMVRLLARDVDQAGDAINAVGKRQVELRQNNEKVLAGLLSATNVKKALS